MQYNPKLTPQKCCNMDDIRSEIDQIDHTVIKLFAARFEYVKAASEFKKSASAVEAKARFDTMLDQRKLWANELGLNGDIIKALYANLVRYFIDEELKQFKNKAKKG